MDSWGVRLTWFDCNIFDGVGGQLFFQFIYLSIFFFFYVFIFLILLF